MVKEVGKGPNLNKHTLGYGASVLLLSGTIMASTYGLHTKNERIVDLKSDLIMVQNDVKVLTAEKEDVMSVNSQLSDKIQNLESNFLQLEEKLDEAGIKIENLNQENGQLKKQLQSKLESEKQKALAKASASSNSTGDWQTFRATYYDANYASTGKTPGHPDYGITASGEKVKVGETVAVDPSVIPLGSWLEVKYPDGHVEKRKATDTGGAIKGNKIDIYIAKASYTSGLHNVQVRILN